MAAFPTPHTVGHIVFNGVGEDPDTGNDAESWADPVDVKVIAWQSSSAESLTGYTSRVVEDIDMAVPADLAVTVRDRFTLPGEDGIYEVSAIEDANHGFHGWKPGRVLKLRKVTG